MASPSMAAGGDGEERGFNLRLALFLAWRSIRQHRVVSLATVIGVAIGMTVVCAVLAVDANTNHKGVEAARTIAAPSATGDATPGDVVRQDFEGGFLTIRAIRKGEAESAAPAPIVPTQEGELADGPSGTADTARRGEQDYQAMRLAVRMASMLAFFIGAVIVFYTMRFSVITRIREFSLLRCLGESRRNVSLSLGMEAFALGVGGTLVGLLLALPVAEQLLAWNISTNGRRPLPGFDVPWGELGFMAALSAVIALLGVAGPMRTLNRLRVAEVLQPRAMDRTAETAIEPVRGLQWLIPPVVAAMYIGVRPFLEDWLSVVQFFVFEAAFITLFAFVTLWWVRPVLKGVIWAFETLMRPIFPVESFLSGRRMRATSHRLVFSVIGATLVFSLLTGLHDITRALKDEINVWAQQALFPYTYFERFGPPGLNERAFLETMQQNGILFFRLSAKSPGDFPIRLVRSIDINQFRMSLGQEPLLPGKTILSRTLAARYGVTVGDTIELGDGARIHRFEIIDVSDRVGFYAESGQYVDLKSFALFSEGNPVFAGTLERSLGRYGMARPANPRQWFLTRAQESVVYPYYLASKRGRGLGFWQIREIDRDFLIFDFILLATVVLAGIGVANTMLIQVHTRDREYAVLRSVGISRGQLGRMLLIEGTIIGLVAAALAFVLGNALGAISVAFLDHFTLFDYSFRFSWPATVLISALCIVSCFAASLYPALVATRTSSAESLHYE